MAYSSSQFFDTGITISKRYTIQNIVASAALGRELDLTHLATSMEGAEYDPTVFPGLVYRVKDPKAASLLFRSGKLVCTGAKNRQQVIKAVELVVDAIRATGVTVDDYPEVTVQNIVASADLGSPVNLSSTVISLGLERVEYEPEVFPGLVYRLDEPKVVMLLFGSGRLVCTGAKKPDDVERAIEHIEAELRASDLLR